MRNVIYKVGRDGYYTYIRDYEGALKQKSADPKYTMETILEEVVPTKGNMTPNRVWTLETYDKVTKETVNKLKMGLDK